MIDWLDIVVQVDHVPAPAGRLDSTDQDGVHEWSVVKRMPLRGSYDKRIMIRSQGSSGNGLASEIYISGNPSKFLQGHNVFGSNDIDLLATAITEKVFNVLKISDDVALQRVKKGEYSIKRVDITESFFFDSPSEVKAVLSALAVQSRTRMGRAQTSGGTVYHGQKSRRFTIKFYDKGEELKSGKSHSLPDDLPCRERLTEYATHLLRVEVTLRTLELKKLNISTGVHIRHRIASLFKHYLGKTEMNTQAKIVSDELQYMKRAIRSTYLLWEKGIDVRSMMSKASFYSHRSQILAYGIDIAIPHEGFNNVIPMFRTVIGQAVSIPTWAQQAGLVYERASQC
mgnify:CR=1 FL=1